MTSIAVNPQIQAPSIEMTSPTSIESGQLGNVNGKDVNYAETKLAVTLFAQNPTYFLNNNSINNKEVFYVNVPDIDFGKTSFNADGKGNVSKNGGSIDQDAPIYEEIPLEIKDDDAPIYEEIPLEIKDDDAPIYEEIPLEIKDDEASEDITPYLIRDNFYRKENYSTINTSEMMQHNVELEDTNQPLSSAQSLTSGSDNGISSFRFNGIGENGSTESMSSSHKEKKGFIEKLQTLANSYMTSILKFVGIAK